MRVLFIDYEYPPIGGGGANANAYLFREFAGRDDLRIDFITSGTGTQLEERQIYPNVTGYFLPVGKKDLHYWRESEMLRFVYQGYRQCRRLLERTHYDLCHCFFGFPSGLLGWWFAGRMPYIVSLRGSDVPGFNARFQAHYVALTPLFRRIWKRAAAVVANSTGLQELAQQTAADVEFEIIPNGIDTDEFVPGPPRVGEPFAVLCVSRLIERKGVQFLIDAWPGVLANVPGAKLVVVGEGDIRQRLQAQAERLGIAASVELRGRIAHEALPAVYQAADVFVLPSMNEGMSNTVLEAMACGLPIVSTATGGSAELLSDNALVVDQRNASSITAALVHMAQHRDEARHKGAISRCRAGQKSWRSVAAQYLKLYERVCNCQSGASRD